MIPGQNELLIDIPLRKDPQILAHGVRRACKPTRAVRRLLGGEHFDKAWGEAGAGPGVGPRNMPVQRGRVELRQDVNAGDLRVDAIIYHPQSGWFEDTPLKGGAEEGYPLKGVHEDTCLLEARQRARNHS